MYFSITLVVIIATSIISATCFSNFSLFEKLKHWPYFEGRDRQYYRMFSGGFVHADWAHLLINMFVMYSFGVVVEQDYQSIFGEDLGRPIYLFMYLTCIIFANSITFVKNKDNYRFSSVGASGGVAGVIFGFTLIHPTENIYLYGIIGIPAFIAAVLYLVYSSYMSRRGGDQIDHTAHFFGAVYGFLFPVVFHPSLLPGFFERILQIFN